MSVEDIVRTTFTEREGLVIDRDVLGPVTARVRRRRRRRALASGFAVLVVLVGAVGAQELRPRPAPDAPDVATAIPADWQTVSSGGAEISVPAGWRVRATDSYGCNSGPEPTVIRGAPMASTGMCSNPEPPTKEMAVLGIGSKLPHTVVTSENFWDDTIPATIGVRRTQVEITGVRAERGEFRLPDGRHAGYVKPERGVAVWVRTTDRDRTRLILDSYRIVTADSLGCPLRAPTTARPPSTPVTGGRFTVREAEVSRVVVCFYGEPVPQVGVKPDYLDSSGALTGESATNLVRAMNEAKPGENPCSPEMLRGTLYPKTELSVVTRLHNAQGAVVGTVFVRYTGCLGRGMDNGSRLAHIDSQILHQLLRPLGVGVGYKQDLVTPSRPK